MWPLYLTREIHIQKRLSASRESILLFIQDPENILRTNPILTSVIPDAANDMSEPTKERWYTIVETVPLFAGQEMATKFRCRWNQVEDGVDMEVFAGLGTRLTTQLRVADTDVAGEVEYTDKVMLQGIFLMMPFIVSRATRSHTMLRDIVAEKAVNSACIPHLVER